MREISSASYSEYLIIKEIGTYNSQATSEKLDKLIGIYNQFISNTSVCRSCSGQLDSVFRIVQGRIGWWCETLDPIYKDYEDLDQDENR